MRRRLAIGGLRRELCVVVQGGVYMWLTEDETLCIDRAARDRDSPHKPNK